MPVEWEPCAEELRLSLDVGSPGVPTDTGTESPLPLSKLGPLLKAVFSVAELELFLSLFVFSGVAMVGVFSADPAFFCEGLGRLDVVTVPPRDGRPMREDCRGGCGNDAMLTDFLTDFSPEVAAEDLLVIVLSVGTAGVDAACACDFGRGIAAFEGVRSFEGVCGAEGLRGEKFEAFKEGLGRLLRVLDMGNGGNAAVGGSYGGNAVGAAPNVVAIVGLGVSMKSWPLCCQRTAVIEQADTTPEEILSRAEIGISTYSMLAWTTLADQ